MSGHVVTRTVHGRLRRIRRRAWLAIALCLLLRVGEAALEASETPHIASSPHTITMPATSATKEFVQ